MENYVIYKVATIFILLIVKHMLVKGLASASKGNIAHIQTVNYMSSIFIGVLIGIVSLYLGNPLDLVVIAGALGSISIFTYYSKYFLTIYNAGEYLRILLQCVITIVYSIVATGFGAIFVIFISGV